MEQSKLTKKQAKVNSVGFDSLSWREQYEYRGAVQDLTGSYLDTMETLYAMNLELLPDPACDAAGTPVSTWLDQKRSERIDIANRERSPFATGD